MTNEQIERAAEVYATQKTEQDVPESYGEMTHRRVAMLFDGYDIEQAFEDGYTACEQSMWRSVEEEEPPIGKLILCRNSNEASLAYYDGEDMYEAPDNTYKVRMPFWMPIPSIPDTNTEKR